MTDRDPFDDQLRDYVRSRADLPVPVGLLSEARVTATSSRRGSWQPFRLLGGLAGAVAVALIVALAMPGFLGTGQPARTTGQVPSPSPGTPAQPTSSPIATAAQTPAATNVPPTESAQATSTPAATGTPPGSTANFPEVVLGLPVLSTSQAQLLIDSGTYEGRAMAVRGWWYWQRISCPHSQDYMNVLNDYCTLPSLAPTSELPWVREGTSGMRWDPPDGSIPARQAAETDLGTGWPVRLGAVGPRTTPVVVVGHVGDPRQWLCSAAALDACRDEFVIDAFVWGDGSSLTMTEKDDADARLSVDDALTKVRISVPESTPILLGSWPGGARAGIDPRLPFGLKRFWLARSIVGPADQAGTARLVEVVIDDATSNVSTRELATEPGATLGGVFFPMRTNPPAHAQLAVRTEAGELVHQTLLDYGRSIPAVLPAGDYVVESWVGERTPPAKPECSGPVSVMSGSVVDVPVDWTNGSCRVVVLASGDVVPPADVANGRCGAAFSYTAPPEGDVLDQLIDRAGGVDRYVANLIYAGSADSLMRARGAASASFASPLAVRLLIHARAGDITESWLGTSSATGRGPGWVMDSYDSRIPCPAPS